MYVCNGVSQVIHANSVILLQTHEGFLALCLTRRKRIFIVDASAIVVKLLSSSSSQNFVGEMALSHCISTGILTSFRTGVKHLTSIAKAQRLIFGFTIFRLLAFILHSNFWTLQSCLAPVL